MMSKVKLLGLLILGSVLFISCGDDDLQVEKPETYDDITLEIYKVSLAVQKEKTVQITAGSGTYTVKNSKQEIAEVILDGANILIKGLTEGETEVTVLDVKSTQLKVIKVTITDYAGKKVFVKGGTFKMGSDDPNDDFYSRPQHEVTLDDFSISKYEVTNAQFSVFLNKNVDNSELNKWLIFDGPFCQIVKKDNLYTVVSGKDNYPVIYVTWEGAKAYAEWVGGDLPTEAQWEYAAKGGSESKGYRYSGSDSINDVAWNSENSDNPDNAMIGTQGSFEVGKLKANELGIHDMTGNVFEWCDTWYADYTTESKTNPKGPTSGEYKIIRGGCWFSYDVMSFNAYRGSDSLGSSNQLYGFRVAFNN